MAQVDTIISATVCCIPRNHDSIIADASSTVTRFFQNFILEFFPIVFLLPS